MTRESETRLALITEILETEKGLSKDDARHEAEQWFMRGYLASEVCEWVDAGIDVDDASGYRAVGYSPRDVSRAS